MTTARVLACYAAVLGGDGRVTEMVNILGLIFGGRWKQTRHGARPRPGGLQPWKCTCGLHVGALQMSGWFAVLMDTGLPPQ